MKHPGAFFLFFAPSLLAGCPRQVEYSTSPAQSYPSQGYSSQGQWSSPQGNAPPAQQGNPPPAYTPQGQWIPPASGATPPNAPWWQPPPSAFPFPIPQLGQAPQLPPLPTDAGQRCVNTINDYRASQRLPPLQRWWQAETCSAGQARDGAASGQPHGAFGRCAEQGQNVCPAWAGPAERMIGPCIQSMWSEGPGTDFAQHGHYLNLSSARFTKVSCGFFTAPTGQVWLVQDFQ